MANAKEPEKLRKIRISESNNGMTLRTRVVQDKKKYKRAQKHKRKPSEAEGYFLFTAVAA